MNRQDFDTRCKINAENWTSQNTRFDQTGSGYFIFKIDKDK